MKIACTLSIEAGESIFSHAVRLCRVNDLPLEEIIGNSALYDLIGLRDLPFCLQHIQTAFDIRYQSIATLAADNSAVNYYGTTIPEPFRSQEFSQSFIHAKGYCRSSLGMAWPHLRYCSQCASAEFSHFRYSWWHRDHQLPLSSICLVHHHPLRHTTLREISNRLPHEIDSEYQSHDKETLRDIQDFEGPLARLEQYMACNNQSELIGNMVTRARRDLFMITADTFEAREFIFANVRSLLIKLEGIRIIYPLRDWDRLQLAINRVLVEGWPFADPVAVALLLISLKRQDLWLSDSLG